MPKRRPPCAVRTCQAFGVLLVGLLPTLACAQDVNSLPYRQTVLAIQHRLETNDLPGARTELSRALLAYPADGGLENLEGVLDLESGNTLAAHEVFLAAVRHSPALLSAYLNVIRLDMETGGARAHEEALLLAGKALQLQPRNRTALLQAATLEMQSARYESSLKRLEGLDEAARGELPAVTVSCGDESALQHVAAAATACAAMEANPDLREADVSQIVEPLRAAHRADLLAALYRSAALHVPLSANGLRLLGLAEEADGKLLSAHSRLEDSFAADPRSSAVLTDLSRVALAQGQTREALGYLAHARELAPGDAALAYQFGVVCFRMNLVGEARKAMGEALAIAPNDPAYNLGMGTVSTLAQDPLEALPYLRRYHDLRPSDPEGVLALGTAYYRAKDFDSARPWLLEASRNAATAPRAHALLGSSLRQQGRAAEAIQELAAAAALPPPQPEVYAELGLIFLQQKNLDRARSELDQALVLDVDNYTANFALLQLYAQTHDNRREAQAERFGQIREHAEQQNREAMRVIEIQPTAP